MGAKRAFSVYDERMAEKHGRVDGRGWRFTILPWFIHRFDPVPKAGSKEVPPFVKEIFSAAEEELARTAAGWERKNGDHQKAAGALIPQLQHVALTSDSSSTDGAGRSAHLAMGLRQQFIQIREQRESDFRIARTHASDLIKRYERLIGAYMRGNLRGRKITEDGAGGDAFKDWVYPPIHFPGELSTWQTLSESLGLGKADVEDLKLPAGGDNVDLPEPSKSPSLSEREGGDADSVAFIQ